MSQHAVAEYAEAAPLFPRAAALPHDLRVVEAGRMILARLSGPLDAEHSQRLMERLRPLCAPSRKLVLDLRWTNFVDSAGVRALLELQDQLHAAHGELRLVVQPRSSVARTFKLLQLHTYFSMFPSASEAWILTRG